MLRVTKSRFPLLETSSYFLSFIAFMLALPVSVVVDVYASFGLFANKSEFVQLRILTLGAMVVCCIGNVLVNRGGILKLLTFNAYVCLIVYIFTVVLLNAEKSAYVGDEIQSAGSYFFPRLFTYVAYFFIGLHVVAFEKFRHVFFISLVVACVVVLQFIDFDTFRIDVANYVEGVNKGNYQGMGDSVGVLSLLVLVFYRSLPVRLAIFFLSLVVLFLIGSRTSFAVYGLVGCVYIAMVTSFRLLLPIVLVGLVGTLMYVEQIDLSDLESRNSRMIGIFTDYEDDNSILGRQELDRLGWEDISNNPILGKFGGQVSVAGAWSAYMHNVFSYWRQFGVLPFALIMMLYAIFMYTGLKYLKRRIAPQYGIAITVGGFLMVASIISRSFTFGYIHMFFGVLVGLHAWLSLGQFDHVGRRKRRRRRRVTQANTTAM